MNTEKTDGLLYKALAFGIFVILGALIVLVSVSTVRSGKDDGAQIPDTPALEDQSPDASDLSDTSDTEPTDTPDTADTSTADTTVHTPQDTTAAPPVTSTSQSAPAVEPPTSNVTEDLAQFLAKYPDTVLGVTPDAGQEYIDKIVFLGDSTTYGLRAYSMLKDGRNTLQVWTPESGTLALYNTSFATIVYPETGEQITIKEAVSRKKPEYLVITLGVNGVSTMKEDYFKSEYRKTVQMIMEASPDTKIICQSMFPVARSYNMLGSINNEKIRNANKWIVEVAHELGVKYLDTYSVLCDAEGWLPEAYHNGDGIHLHTVSFNIELDNIRTHAYTD